MAFSLFLAWIDPILPLHLPVYVRLPAACPFQFHSMLVSLPSTPPTPHGPLSSFPSLNHIHSHVNTHLEIKS